MVTINQKETRAQKLSNRLELKVISKYHCDLLLEISKIEQQANTPEDFEFLEEKIKEFKSRFVLSEGEWEDGVDSNEELLETESGEPFELGEVETLPTKWFKTEQISTWIGESLTTEGKTIEEINGGHGILIVQHQCGDNKEALISQLNTMIDSIKNGPDYFAN